MLIPDNVVLIPVDKQIAFEDRLGVADGDAGLEDRMCGLDVVG